MATYYWVGGAGTWNASATTNWASSSNGSGGAGFPTSVDDVIIDSSSGTGTITCTLGVCNNLTVTASQGITLGGTSLSIFGSLTFPSGGSFSVTTTTITFAATTTGKTITTNGKTVQSITFNGVGGEWTLQDALTLASTRTLTLTNGSFNANGFAVTAGLFSSTNSNIRTLTLGNGLWTLSGTGTVWNTGTITNLTFNANTSDILLSSTSTSARTFSGGGLTYNKITIGGTTGTSNTSFGTTSVSDTINELASIKTVAHTIRFAAGSTINTWSVTGTTNNVVTVVSTTEGTLRTIQTPNKTNNIDYLSMRDILVNLDSSNTYNFYAGTNSTHGTNVHQVAFIDRSTNNKQVAQFLGSEYTLWTTPNDWNNSNNKIYMIGGGGSGANSSVSSNNKAAGGGGGGGGFGLITNFNSDPGVNVSVSIASTSAVNVSGGNTSWANTYTVFGGSAGTASGNNQTSTGGVGGGYSGPSGTTTTFEGYTGGTGGAGAFDTTPSAGYGGGGGGGAAGPFGNGGNGGDGFGPTTTADSDVRGGGGGGGGGGSNGTNATISTTGAGGNGWLGTGGGAANGASGTYGTGGGAAGSIGSVTQQSPTKSTDILNTIGGSGGFGGRSNPTLGVSIRAYTYGFGGGGAGTRLTTGTSTGIPGGPGFIFIVYTERDPTNFAYRIANTGNLFVPTTSNFDEITQAQIGVTNTAFYAEEFDEVTNPGIPLRYLNTSVVQTQGIIDEVTGIL